MRHNDVTMPTASAVPKPTRAAKRWGPERRLEFIDFRLRWDGRLNRADLVAFFGVSIPQASLDIASYMEVAPQNLLYDRTERVYLATSKFRPVYSNTTPARYLSEVLAIETGVIQPEASFLGWRPPSAIVPVPGRQMDSKRLLMLLRAVHEKTGLRVLYQSLSQPEPSWREISPHAFAHDGFRWHVRAFCHSRLEFRDFLVPRMLKVEAFHQAGPPSKEDLAWGRYVDIVLTPNDDLPLAHQQVIALDYGMVDGTTKLRCRQALVFYALKHLGLLQDSSLESSQVRVQNMPDLEEFTRPRQS